jgi:hypothetical protein
MKRAIKKAIPDTKELEKAQKEKTLLQNQLNKLIKTKDKLIDSYIERGLITKDEFEKRISQFREKISVLENKLEIINNTLSIQPDQKMIEYETKLTKLTIERIYKNTPHRDRMTYEDKKELMQLVFNGKDIKNKKRYGVYVYKNTDEYEFEIYGNIIELNGMFKLDSIGKCNAHHRFGLYK